MVLINLLITDHLAQLRFLGLNGLADRFCFCSVIKKDIQTGMDFFLRLFQN